MRPPRIIIAVAFFLTTVLLTFLSLRSSHSPQTITTAAPTAPKTGVHALFSFSAPFSLFPPNAIITLTHDNTTAFLARPAAFGPLLPTHGLKGQVWIGSGFGDESVRQGTVAAGAEGELGCSDVPGWPEKHAKSGVVISEGDTPRDGTSATRASKTKPRKRANDEVGPFDDHTTSSTASSKKGTAINDGTDDYLHHPLPESKVSKVNENSPLDAKAHHADIQSIQEGAEITGKVVLLSRGGCGFLEKVKWAQRRGAVALIVGDDTQGGPLIQMYARGDTSNVSIPSVFTSRTTAHLLSSLIGPGSFIEDSIDENGKPSLSVQHSGKKQKGKKHGSRPTFTPTAITRATGTIRPTRRPSRKMLPRQGGKPATVATQKSGWFRSLFLGSKNRASTETSRPPSSGRLDWVLVDDWKDEDDAKSEKLSSNPNKGAGTTKGTELKSKPASKAVPGDDFVIGVQDWRDPDLVVKPGAKDVENGKGAIAKASGKLDAIQGPTPQPARPGRKHLGGALQEIPEYHPQLRGGSITPGSGEYDTTETEFGDDASTEAAEKESPSAGKSKGLLTAIFGEEDEDIDFPGPQMAHKPEDDEDGEHDDSDEHEGLWVTLTPASGASPFLDTLLVLVVSPLVTLTVVYALLLIRSRIRRRRWRAPKSVVERLPVRTYQTIVPSGTPSPRVPSPTSSSDTTPLLRSQSPTRPRPRSRTTTGIPESGDLMRVRSDPLQIPSVPPRVPEHEKNASVSSEWKKHMGKQVECVVCLEEYIAGVSRVMSLPCGHEFHVDCITPWLTTRRRTCPICKGDVVRSLARGSSSSPRYEPYHDDSDDDDNQGQAATTINNSSSAALPIGGASYDNDLEQGIASPTPTRPLRNIQPGNWRAMLANRLGSTSRSPRPSHDDRDR